MWGTELHNTRGPKRARDICIHTCARDTRVHNCACDTRGNRRDPQAHTPNTPRPGSGQHTGLEGEDQRRSGEPRTEGVGSQCAASRCEGVDLVSGPRSRSKGPRSTNRGPSRATIGPHSRANGSKRTSWPSKRRCPGPPHAGENG